MHYKSNYVSTLSSSNAIMLEGRFVKTSGRKKVFINRQCYIELSAKLFNNNSVFIRLTTSRISALIDVLNELKP